MKILAIMSFGLIIIGAVLYAFSPASKKAIKISIIIAVLGIVSLSLTVLVDDTSDWTGFFVVIIGSFSTLFLFIVSQWFKRSK